MIFILNTLNTASNILKISRMDESLLQLLPLPDGKTKEQFSVAIRIYSLLKDVKRDTLFANNDYCV